MSRIAVAGAGTWGIALARMLLLSGHEVSVWSALPEEIDELSANRTHKNLPGMVIPDEMVFSKDLGSVCSGAEVIVMAVPSVFVRSTAKTLAPLVSDDAGAKQIYRRRLLYYPSPIIKDEIGNTQLVNVTPLA